MKLRALLVGLAACVCVTAAQAEEPIVIKFSHVVATDTPKGKAAEHFKQLAEERTELAQARAELTRVKAEIAEQERPLQQMPDEATTQIYALRQHLQEIHEQEKHEREQRRFSRRIARLWKRFEG